VGDTPATRRVIWTSFAPLACSEATLLAGTAATYSRRGAREGLAGEVSRRVRGRGLPERSPATIGQIPCPEQCTEQWERRWNKTRANWYCPACEEVQSFTCVSLDSETNSATGACKLCGTEVTVRLNRPPTAAKGPKRFRLQKCEKDVCGVCGGTKRFLTTAKTQCKSCGNVEVGEDA
jgi:hypothetical protein